MTAMLPPTEALQAFHTARSRVIDAFGLVEREIVSLLRDADAKILRAPLGQKIAAVRKIEPSPRYSKKRRAVVLEALDELTPLLERRAEIAHSTMQLIRIRGEAGDRAGFSNPTTQPEHGERVVLYLEQDLATLAKTVTDIAKKLAPEITQASSPPQP